MHRDQDVLNIQPVIPLHIGENWNLITRIDSADRLATRHLQQPTGQGWYGLGDMNPTLLLVAGEARKLIWAWGQRL